MSSLAPTELFSLFAPASWRAAWLIVVLIGLRRLVRGRIPAQVWFAAWLVVALRLLLPFSIPVAWSPYNLAAMAPARVAAQPAVMPTIVSAPALAKVIVPAEVSASPVRATEIAAAPVEKPRTLPAPAVMPVQPAPIDGGAVAALVWIAGVILIAAVRLLAAGWFRRQLAHATPLDDGRVAAVVAEESQRHGRAAAIPSFETDAVDAPALYGIVRPRLLFPPEFARQLDDAELRLVVRHELAHWRRRDLLAQALLQAAVTLHWFNPLAWIAAKLARLDCELACDEFVLRRESRDGVSAYGATLLKVLGVVRGRRRPGAVVAIIEGRQQLAQRVRLIADYRGTTLARVAGGVALVGLIAATSLTRESRAAATVAPAASVESPAPATAPAAGQVTIGSGAVEIKPAAPTPTEVSPPPNNVLANSVTALALVTEQQQTKVTQLARELQAFKEANKFFSADQRRDLIDSGLKAANGELLRAQQELAAIQVQVSQVREFRARGGDLASLPFIASQPLVAQLKSQLASKQIQKTSLASRYREQYPDMVRLTAEIKETEQLLARMIDEAGRLVETSEVSAARNYEDAKRRFAQRTQESVDLDRLFLVYNDKLRELRTQEQILQNLTTWRDELSANRTSATPAPTPAVGSVPAGFTVSVMGAVRQQGAIAFARDDTPIVLDAIARAGGYSDRADRNAVRLLRLQPDGSRKTEVMTEAMMLSPAGPDATLRRGDVIVVAELMPEPEVKGVTVFGQVNNPGVYSFPGVNGKMTVVDLLAKAGGGTRFANLRTVSIKRIEAKDGSMRVFPVDVAAFLSGTSNEMFELRPGDIVVVPERTL